MKLRERCEQWSREQREEAEQHSLAVAEHPPAAIYAAVRGEKAAQPRLSVLQRSDGSLAIGRKEVHETLMKAWRSEVFDEGRVAQPAEFEQRFLRHAPSVDGLG